MTGQKCNMLLVLSENKSRGNRLYWKCLCDCGKEKFICGTDLRNGRISCGCYRQARKTNKEVCHNILIKSYQTSAQNRNLQWNISDNIFIKLIHAACYYCGEYGSNKINVRNKYIMNYNGIDRVDNIRGYICENVVSCCKTCNRAKGTVTQKEFLQWINRVYNNSRRNINELL